MKKTVILIFCVQILTQAKAQSISQKMFVGVNTIAFGRKEFHKTKLLTGIAEATINSKTLYAVVIPQFGVQIKHDLRLGLSFGFRRDQKKDKSEVDGYNPNNHYNHKTNYILRALLIKDLCISDRIIFFIQANFDFIKEREKKEQYSASSSGLYSHRASYFNPNIIPGIRSKISDRLDLEMTFGTIGYLLGKLTTDAGSIDSEYDSKKLEINFTAKTLTLGMKYYFNKATEN